MRKDAGVATHWDRRRFIAFFLSGLVMMSIALPSAPLAQVATTLFAPTL